MPVGAFPTIADFRRRTIKSPDNPMDRATIVSIFPKEIDEVKYTIQPGRFVIQPGTYDKPAVLTVGSSSWWREIDEESPLLEIPISSVQIAESVVKDYCNGLLGCDMGDLMPGLFWIPGTLGVNEKGEFNLIAARAELATKYQALVEKAKLKQTNWFKALVAMADTLWSRSQGNPLAISDDMRLAADQLGLTTKEWLADFKAQEMIRCVNCGSMRNPVYPTCPSCHAIIDRKRYDELNLSQAIK